MSYQNVDETAHKTSHYTNFGWAHSTSTEQERERERESKRQTDLLFRKGCVISNVLVNVLIDVLINVLADDKRKIVIIGIGRKNRRRRVMIVCRLSTPGCVRMGPRNLDRHGASHGALVADELEVAVDRVPIREGRERHLHRACK